MMGVECAQCCLDLGKGGAEWCDAMQCNAVWWQSVLQHKSRGASLSTLRDTNLMGLGCWCDMVAEEDGSWISWVSVAEGGGWLWVVLEMVNLDSSTMRGRRRVRTIW